MLKNRIIPVMSLLGDRLVKTVRFEPGRDVGDPVKSAQVYNSQAADELLFLNIGRHEDGIAPLMRFLEPVARGCFMPLTAGGGVRDFNDVAALIRGGADKAAINSAVFDDPDLIARAADRFGSQAVVVVVDVRHDPVTGGYAVYSHGGRRRRDVGLLEHVETCIAQGAGEILIQSIDRDGVMAGFDLDLIAAVAERSPVPVIALGGCGHYDHLREVFQKTRIKAAACGSLFNFTDSNPIRAKAFLSNHGLPFRKA